MIPSCILAPPEQQNQNDRQTFLGGALHRSSNLFSDYMPHASHQESGVTDTYDSILAVNLSFADSHALMQPGFFLYCLQLLLIIRKIQRILTFQILEPGRKALGIRHHFQAVLCLDAEIVAALIADIFIRHYLCFIQRSSTGLAYQLLFLFCNNLFLFLFTKPNLIYNLCSHFTHLFQSQIRVPLSPPLFHLP